MPLVNRALRAAVAVLIAGYLTKLGKDIYLILPHPVGNRKRVAYLLKASSLLNSTLHSFIRSPPFSWYVHAYRSLKIVRGSLSSNHPA